MTDSRTRVENKKSQEHLVVLGNKDLLKIKHDKANNSNKSPYQGHRSQLKELPKTKARTTKFSPEMACLLKGIFNLLAKDLQTKSSVAWGKE